MPSLAAALSMCPAFDDLSPCTPRSVQVQLRFGVTLPPQPASDRAVTCPPPPPGWSRPSRSGSSRTRSGRPGRSAARVDASGAGWTWPWLLRPRMPRLLLTPMPRVFGVMVGDRRRGSWCPGRAPCAGGRDGPSGRSAELRGDLVVLQQGQVVGLDDPAGLAQQHVGVDRAGDDVQHPAVRACRSSWRRCRPASGRWRCGRCRPSGRTRRSAR